jgi:hypothetical protein
VSPTPLFDARTSVYDEAPGSPGFHEGRFREFNAENPHIYRSLVNLAREAKGHGCRHYGIAALYEVLRWRWLIEVKTDDAFKLNNNHRAYYAREIMRREIDLADFFETRTAGHEKAEADE